MYQPAHFVESRPEVLHALMRDHPLGLLITHGADGLAANTLPFLFEPGVDGACGQLVGHVARANPLSETSLEGPRCWWCSRVPGQTYTQPQAHVTDGKARTSWQGRADMELRDGAGARAAAGCG